MQAARPLVRTVSRQVRSYHGPPSNHVPPHMNELPVPCGSWKEAHAAKNRYYNTVLVAGITFATVSFIVGKSSGLFYFNYNPPQSID